MAALSLKTQGYMCKPELVEISKNTQAFIEIRQMRHPCLCQAGVKFVPNDILLGEYDSREPGAKASNIMLLTGSNMGGKSTVLRMACLSAILSQIGCFVPAKSCRLSVVDRIFTRIGASDNLLQDKSTFFIEMEETANISQLATRNSLAIIDELGRGTSTFDGVAIAYAVLKHLVQNVKCLALFATHYHILLEYFQLYDEIKYSYMKTIIDENQNLIFLYKLTDGQFGKSFAVRIAQMVGLPEIIIKNAEQKAREFKKEAGLETIRKQNQEFNKIIQCFP